MEKLPFGSISSILAPILELHLQIGLLECEYVQEALKAERNYVFHWVIYGQDKVIISSII